MRLKILLISSLFLFSIQSEAQNLKAGLRAYFPFNGNADDASGNDNTAASNNATLTADRHGNANSAYHFNGKDSKMRILNSPSINSTKQLSVCIWVKVDDFYKGKCHVNAILMKGNADYLPGNYFIRFDDNTYNKNTDCNVKKIDKLHQNFYSPWTNTALSADGNPPFIEAGKWYAVVYTYDGLTARMFVDGELKASHTDFRFNFSNEDDLMFGRLNSAEYPYWFTGDLDEVRIYDRALSMEEINEYSDRKDSRKLDGIVQMAPEDLPAAKIFERPSEYVHTVKIKADSIKITIPASSTPYRLTVLMNEIVVFNKVEVGNTAISKTMYVPQHKYSKLFLYYESKIESPVTERTILVKDGKKEHSFNYKPDLDVIPVIYLQ